MKALKYLAVAAVIILGFTACEKKDNNQSIGSDVITEQAYTDLFQRLDEYNSTFEFDTPNESLQKKGGRFWNWLQRVVSYDASGALIGGMVLGVGGSIGAGVMFSLIGAVTNPYTDQINSSDVINKPTYEIVDNEVGVWHNRIIEEVLVDYPDVLDGVYTEEELLGIVGGKLEAHDIATTQELKNVYEGRNAALIKEMSLAADAKAISAAVVKAYPALQKEMEVVEVYIENVEKNATLEKKVEYTEGVVQVVKQSNISAAAKNNIISSASVYANSSALWGK